MRLTRGSRRNVCPIILAAMVGAPCAMAQEGVPLLKRMNGGEAPCCKAGALVKMYDEGLNPDGTGRTGPDVAALEAPVATDLLTCFLDIELVPSSGTQNIIGTNTMTVKSLVNGLTQFTFRLRSQFNITTLTVNGVNATWASSGTYGRTVNLPTPKNAGDEFTVVVGYNGLAVSRGFGSIEFGTLSGNTSVFTLSEAYFAATWWPVKDGDFGLPGDNGDKFLPTVWITAPSTLTSVSNGLLQGVDTLSGGRKRYRWSSSYPIAPYLVSIGSTVYAQTDYTYNHSGGSMPVNLYITPANNSAGNRAVWAKCVDMLATFEPYFGMYPFVNEKYGIYEFVFGGGMEHQTITGQGGGFSEGVTAHELGHQWWGDNVTCKTWNHIWLNEGFATFSECVWSQYKPGSSGWPAYYSAMAGKRPTSPGVTLVLSDAEVADMNAIFNSNRSYNKGCWVVHMLRGVMGDTLFFQGLQNYRAAFQGSGATTDDFEAVMSSTLGEDLSYFFDQWAYNGGNPAYQHGWQTFTVNGQSYLRLMVKQTQGSPLFKMPVKVRVNYSGGNQLVTVPNAALANQWFVVPINAPATSIVFDENDWILDSSTSAVTYVQGPPKVVQATPALGAVIAAQSAPSAITVTFSDNVTAAAADVVVTRNGNPEALGFGYNSGTFTATLTNGSALAAGVYVVTVKDTIKSAVGAIALDGEIANGSSPASLPSGNGVASGQGVYTFTVEGCPSDVNGDGFVTGEDFDEFVAAFELGDAFADYNGDTFVTGEDFDEFVEDFSLGC